MPLTWTGNSGILTLSPDSPAADYIKAVEDADGQALEPAVKASYDRFILGCKADGIWDAIKASCILAGARTLDGALVPLVGTAPDNFNFVGIGTDYDRVTGLLGNATTKYLESNYAFPTNLQNNCHLSIYETAVRTTGVSIGYGDALSHGSFVSSASARLYQRSDSTYFFPDTTTPGFRGVSRDNSANYDTRYPPGISDLYAKASLTVTHDTFAIFGRKRPGPSIDGYTDARLTFYSAGEFLDLALLDNRVSQLMTDLGAAIP